MFLREFWSLAFSRRIVINAVKVALTVGTILNIINQGAAILHWHGISWLHVALNYITPYCVATWSAAKNELDRRKAE
ncbi:MAG: nitrate/nitrite transporter NrtS [Asticcacaulis sp.]|nr:nitrate/nitrite transporter NrtS [Asticcacaulis sp.]